MGSKDSHGLRVRTDARADARDSSRALCCGHLFARRFLAVGTSSARLKF